jgi:DNA-directed RNA polymerase alpha subunit
MARQVSAIPDDDFASLSKPAQRALAGAGIHSLRELAGFSEAEIGKLHGMGPKSLSQLRAALKGKGLAFRTARKP